MSVGLKADILHQLGRGNNTVLELRKVLGLSSSTIGVALRKLAVEGRVTVSQHTRRSKRYDIGGTSPVRTVSEQDEADMAQLMYWWIHHRAPANYGPAPKTWGCRPNLKLQEGWV